MDYQKKCMVVYNVGIYFQIVEFKRSTVIISTV